MSNVDWSDVLSTTRQEMENIKVAFARAGIDIESKINKISEAFYNGVDKIENFCQDTNQALQTVREQFDPFVESIQAKFIVLEYNFDKFSKLANSIGGSIGKVSGTIFAFAKSSLAKLDEKTKGIRNSIKSASAVFGKFCGAVSNVHGAIGKVGGTIVNAGKKVASFTESIGKLKGMEKFGTNLSTMKDQMDDLKGTAAKVAFPFLEPLSNAGVKILGDFSKKIKDANGDMNKMGKAVDETVTTAVTQFTKAAPKYMAQGAALIESVIKGLEKGLPKVGPKCAKLIQTLVSKLSASSSKLVNTGGKLFDFVVNGIVKAIPKITKTATKIITKLADGIVKAIPKITKTATKIITKLMDGIIKAIPKLANAATKIVNSLGTNIGNALPKLVPKAVKMITTIVKALIDNLPKILDAALKIVVGLGTGIVKSLPTLAKQAPVILKSLANGIKGSLSVISNVGKGIVTGIWNGISQKFSWLKSKIAGVGKNIVGAFKNVLKINSPSKVMQDDIGKGIVEGVATGIDKNKKMAITSAENMSSDVIEKTNKRFSEQSIQFKKSWEEQEKYWAGTVKRSQKGNGNNTDLLKEFNEKRKKLYADQTETLKKSAEEIKGIYSKLNDDIKKVNDEFDKSVQSRADSIVSSMNLFEEFSANKEVTGEGLLSNLEGQVKGLEEWSKTLESLQGKGFSEELIKMFQEMGPQSLAEMNALNSLSGEQVMEYNSLYEKKKTNAKDQATKELTPEKDKEIDKLTKKADEDAKKKVKDTQDTLQKQIDAFNESLKKSLNTSKKNGKNEGKKVVDEVAKGMSNQAKAKKTKEKIEVVNTTVKTSLKKLSTIGKNSGKDLMNGIIQGMKSKVEELEAVTAQIMEMVETAAKAAAEIHSPSRKMARMVGAPLAQGIGVGFAKEMENVSKQIEKSLPSEFDVHGKVNMGSGSMGQTGNPAAHQSKDITVIQNIYADETNYAKQQREAAKQFRLIARTV